jgi:hypothetical protein
MDLPADPKSSGPAKPCFSEPVNLSEVENEKPVNLSEVENEIPESGTSRRGLRAALPDKKVNPNKISLGSIFF